LLDFSRDAQALLTTPIDPLRVEIRPDGIVFAGWTEYATRLDQAIGIGQWTLVPQGKPMSQDGFVCWQFDLWCRGHWVATAIGEHPDPGNRRMSLANRAESAKSDALVKCAKALGIFRELWDTSWRLAWMETHAIRAWAKQFDSSNRYAWLWRRKDRPPFAAEGKPGRTSESEYDRGRKFEDDAREHIDAIARSNS
jgi:hypothetical protein